MLRGRPVPGLIEEERTMARRNIAPPAKGGVRTGLALLLALSTAALVLALAAGQASAQTVLVYEAESLQETRSATASLRAQGNCCGITWSDDAQLLFRSTKIGDTFTVGGRSFTVPDGGAYDFSAVLTRGPDYGAYQLAIDGREIGTPFDAYNPTVEKPGPLSFGKVRLQKGTHTLTLTVLGKNPAATNYYAGLDVLYFER